jgi:hypothetical protein
MIKRIKLKFISIALLIAMLFLFSGCEPEDLSKRTISNIGNGISITSTFDKKGNILQKTECNYEIGTILITNYKYSYVYNYGYACTSFDVILIDENYNIINVTKSEENNNEQ